jgi:hypothetical protein
LNNPDPEIVKRARKRIQEKRKIEKDRIESHFKMILEKDEKEK